MSYTVFRKLETGELLQVATRDDLREAERLAQALDQYWPADYPVLDAPSAAEVERNASRSRLRAASSGTGMPKRRRESRLAATPRKIA